MPNIRIFSDDAGEYTRLLEGAGLPAAVLMPAGQSLSECEIAFGEPYLVATSLSQLASLRWVQSTWAGVNPLLDPALRRDYILTNVRGIFGGLMSEYILAYLLLHERRILARLEAQRQKRWDSTLTGTLQGKTFGLLGVGSIGAELARTAKFFGMQVRGFTRSSEDSPDVDQYYHDGALPEFAAGLDYLVSILPDTRETHKLVTASVFACLPPHALFINIGRGSALDEGALDQALRTGQLAGAVLDVFEQEPLPLEHPFWSTPNLIITSHSAGPSFPADITRLFIENYRRYTAEEPLLYQVDFEKGY